MEVAPFHPSACAEDSSLWPSSSRHRARALPCIPLCGARTFLCTCVQRLPGRLPLQFYRQRHSLRSGEARRRSCADACTSYCPTSRARNALRTTCCSPASTTVTCASSRSAVPSSGRSMRRAIWTRPKIVHGAAVGLALGGIIGALAGALVVAYPPEGISPKLVAVLIGMLVGAPLGAWMASMVGAAVPNSRLKQFDADLEAGRVLMMIDVPYRRVTEITELVVSRHPEAVQRGEAMRYVFP